MIAHLKEIPSWLVLLILLVVLLVMWEIRPDSTIEALITGTSSALLLSLRSATPPPPPPPA